MDAVTRMKRDQVDLDQLPDTGERRSDLLGLFARVHRGRRTEAPGHGGSELNAGRPPPAVESADSAVVEQWETAIRILLERARGRGDVAAESR